MKKKIPPKKVWLLLAKGVMWFENWFVDMSLNIIFNENYNVEYMI